MDRLPPVSSLMSPPEPKPFDSFSVKSSLSPCVSPESSFNRINTLPPISAERKRNQSEMMDLPSPPVTPYVGHKKRRSSADELVDRDQVATISNKDHHHRDPVLFPRADDAASAILPHASLFAPEAESTAEALVDNYIANQAPRYRLPDKVTKPTRDEYLFALSCVPVVTTHYNRNPGAWAMQERKLLERQMSMMSRYNHVQPNGKLKKIAPAPSKRTGTSGGTQGTSNGNARTSRAARTRRSPKSTPKSKARDSFDSSSPNQPRATPKPTRVIGANRDETNYRELPDYSPPIETLRGHPKGLKADWKGQMLDLSNDPDRDALGPAEYNLAATLRLSCASYLASKRRIFQARVEALRIGKEFRKTDAQQACKIDVNKASKLWTAYDRVGWLDPTHFRQYI
ncbi:hypothetical protein FQN57_006715 [Myotisia sp. PD_48]|nr:hypothetical protein FQN57_006715 [Myotisia sp. PD_48]